MSPCSDDYVCGSSAMQGEMCLDDQSRGQKHTVFKVCHKILTIFENLSDANQKLNNSPSLSNSLFDPVSITCTHNDHNENGSSPNLFYVVVIIQEHKAPRRTQLCGGPCRSASFALKIETIHGSRAVLSPHVSNHVDPHTHVSSCNASWRVPSGCLFIFRRFVAQILNSA